MAVFGTIAWMNVLKDRLNQSDQFQRGAKGWSASMQYEILPEPAGPMPEGGLIGLRVEDGKTVEVWEGERETDYRMIAPFAVFRAINLGELNAMKAIMFKKMKIRGNAARLARESRAINALQTIIVEMSRDGTTKWPPSSSGK